MVQTWSTWKRFPDAHSGGVVEAPIGPGVYEVRHTMTGRVVAFGSARNVANAVSGFKQVTMEDVLTWNPAVIFVQERYPTLVDEIKKADSWRTIDAVKNGRIYLMPEYAKAWGYPMPEAMALGELWMAKELYPERFMDIDMQKEADAYYKEFYRTDYRAAQ